MLPVPFYCERYPLSLSRQRGGLELVGRHDRTGRVKPAARPPQIVRLMSTRVSSARKWLVALDTKSFSGLLSSRCTDAEDVLEVLASDSKLGLR